MYKSIDPTHPCSCSLVYYVVTLRTWSGPGSRYPVLGAYRALVVCLIVELVDRNVLVSM